MNSSQNLFLQDLSYSLRRYYVDDFYLRHTQDLGDGVIILDLGGTRVQKRGAFDVGRCHAQVVYANLSADKKPDVQCRAESIPVRSKAVNVVICAELLEHVKDPVLVLSETFRVLRHGGILLMCTPFLNRIHADPSDYGRYTEFYWREILSAIGFEDITVEWQGSFWSVLMEMLRYVVSYRSLAWGSGRNWLIRVMAFVFFWLKRGAITWDRDNDGTAAAKYLGFTTGFGVKAVRP